MIGAFIIVLIFFLSFRAIGTANKKSPLDRMGEMISWKPMEKEEPEVKEEEIKKEPGPKKHWRAIKVFMLSQKYPMLDKVWKRCNMEEKEKINDAVNIYMKKRWEILSEEGKAEKIE